MVTKLESVLKEIVSPEPVIKYELFKAPKASRLVSKFLSDSALDEVIHAVNEFEYNRMVEESL